MQIRWGPHASIQGIQLIQCIQAEVKFSWVPKSESPYCCRQIIVSPVRRDAGPQPSHRNSEHSSRQCFNDTATAATTPQSSNWASCTHSRRRPARLEEQSGFYCQNGANVARPHRPIHSISLSQRDQGELLLLSSSRINNQTSHDKSRADHSGNERIT